jgi:hypothetical protein
MIMAIFALQFIPTADVSGTTAELDPRVGADLMEGVQCTGGGHGWQQGWIRIFCIRSSQFNLFFSRKGLI